MESTSTNSELLKALEDCAEELQRLRDVLLPQYAGKIGEPDVEILNTARALIAKSKKPAPWTPADEARGQAQEENDDPNDLPCSSVTGHRWNENDYCDHCGADGRS